jgi:hypothetical protein
LRQCWCVQFLPQSSLISQFCSHAFLHIKTRARARTFLAGARKRFAAWQNPKGIKVYQRLAYMYTRKWPNILHTWSYLNWGSSRVVVRPRTHTPRPESASYRSVPRGRSQPPAFNLHTHTHTGVSRSGGKTIRQSGSPPAPLD